MTQFPAWNDRKYFHLWKIGIPHPNVFLNIQICRYLRQIEQIWLIFSHLKTQLQVAENRSTNFMWQKIVIYWWVFEMLRWISKAQFNFLDHHSTNSLNTSHFYYMYYNLGNHGIFSAALNLADLARGFLSTSSSVASNACFFNGRHFFWNKGSISCAEWIFAEFLCLSVTLMLKDSSMSMPWKWRLKILSSKEWKEIPTHSLPGLSRWWAVTKPL